MKIQWKLEYSTTDISDLNQNFSNFLQKNHLEFNSNDIVSSAITLELFLYENFDITHNLPKCDERIIRINKNFIQRTVFQKYKNSEIPNSWENEYNFISQEEFIHDVSLEEHWGSFEKYVAFAIFTTNGKKKHKNDSIFHLPKNISEKDDFIQVDGNCIKLNANNDITQRNGFNLSDDFPQKQAMDWNLGYCLYCHKREKDSCSKGLHTKSAIKLNEEKQGCPLKQDISESIFLKRDNFHIASLAVIMKENPLCILTGRRICQNCEEACIFQKQEAVDIQSIETQILIDILSMDFGIEIYNLLLVWNPVSNERIYNIKGKAVVVAGLGPAGLFATHLFSKFGAKVLGIDALNIEIPEKIKKISQNIIKYHAEILTEPLEMRMPSGIGGVMEYGITVRWNKNFLDILIGLLLRRKNVEFQGSTRIGGLLNYSDIFKNFNFNHIALCVGSAKPQLPAIKGIFSGYSLTNGIMMASDFLMSLHIDRESNFLRTVVNSPVYILGCGLTAIDTACEVRAFLRKMGQNIDVKILYYQDIAKSSSYKINHFEFKKAIEEGIEIIQNVEILEIKKNNGRISHIILKSEEILECNLLIIAIGTKPNFEHIADFVPFSESISLFGDCNPEYTGSVVNALASVKYGIHDAMQKINNNNNITENYSEIFIRNISISQITKSDEHFFEIRIYAPFFVKKAKAGNVLKFQEMYKKSLALTIAKIDGDFIILYIQNTNNETRSIIDAIQHGRKIHINGINCSTFPEIPENSIIVASKKAQMIFTEIFKDKKLLLPEEFLRASFNSNKANLFIVAEDEFLQKITSQQSHLETKMYKLFIYQKMNCMLGGICGRCIKPDGTYACINNIIDK